MSYRPRYDKGDWNAICDSCGRHVKASELRQRWDGLMVCSDDWEPRHPQDFVRGIADFQAPPFTRPEPTDTFVSIAYTRQFTDSIPLQDQIYLGNSKYLNITFSFSDSSLNSYALNGYGINATNLTQTPGSSENISFSESLVFGDLEQQAEALSLGESLSLVITSGLSLNGAALNTFGLD